MSEYLKALDDVIEALQNASENIDESNAPQVYIYETIDHVLQMKEEYKRESSGNGSGNPCKEVLLRETRRSNVR